MGAAAYLTGDAIVGGACSSKSPFCLYELRRSSLRIQAPAEHGIKSAEQWRQRASSSYLNSRGFARWIVSARVKYVYMTLASSIHALIGTAQPTKQCRGIPRYSEGCSTRHNDFTFRVTATRAVPDDLREKAENDHKSDDGTCPHPRAHA